MITILISGSGTGVGKTRVAAALASAAARGGRRAQIVKPVQTGLKPDEISDADTAAALADAAGISAHTLRRYPAALAPVAAAEAAGTPLDADALVRETLALPVVDMRIIEGAGGLAVPLKTNGWDWVDFAEAIRADAVVLVVPDQLGAIHQARVVFHYLQTKHARPVRGGIFLNGLINISPEVQAGTRAALAAARVPLWGELAAGALKAMLHSPLGALLGA